jgi:hypothetical protein
LVLPASLHTCANQVALVGANTHLLSPATA